MKTDRRRIERLAAAMAAAPVDDTPPVDRPSLAERERGRTWRPNPGASDPAVSWGNVRTGDARYPTRELAAEAVARLDTELA